MTETASPKTSSRFWDDWVDKRCSVSSGHQLHHRNLYVLPTKSGCAFVFLALVVWLLGTNYQNNLILALAYLQLSIVVVVILHTYNNMSGLHIDCLGSSDGHVGEAVAFKFRLSSNNRTGCHRLKAGWRGTVPVIIDVGDAEPEHISVTVEADRRGRLPAPRLLLQSEFPLGLVKCWSWLRFDAKALVYPAPLACASPPHASGDYDGGGAVTRAMGGEEFHGYSPYVDGHSLRHVDWKQYARERGLLSKLYGNEQAADKSLSWQEFFDGDPERTLSRMAYWALHFHDQGVSFSLQLPDIRIERGIGDAHLAAVLSALALHGQA